MLISTLKIFPFPSALNLKFPLQKTFKILIFKNPFWIFSLQCNLLKVVGSSKTINIKILIQTNPFLCIISHHSIIFHRQESPILPPPLFLQIYPPSFCLVLSQQTLPSTLQLVLYFNRHPMDLTCRKNMCILKKTFPYFQWQLKKLGRDH